MGPDDWVECIHDSSRIGGYYRGFVSSETELDILLTLHKNATKTSWGTRQSPTPGKQIFDGISVYICGAIFFCVFTFFVVQYLFMCLEPGNKVYEYEKCLDIFDSCKTTERLYNLSTGKSAQRLLWKSQYVPFDGIPFINLGSRAIVMECQFGARRQSAAAAVATNNADGAPKTPRVTNLMRIYGNAKKKKQGEIDENFKECCPARLVWG